MEKSKQPDSSSNIVQYVLIGLLIVAAFFIGSLWTKVGTLENKGGSAGKVADNAAANPSAEASAPVDVNAMAQNAGLNVEDFKNCVTSKDATDEVAAEEASGATAGVQGTPGIFLVDTKTGKGIEIPGAVPYAQLKASLDKVIAGTDLTDLKLSAITDKEPIKGDSKARYALVEYSDYDCPYCKQFDSTANQLLKEYEGKVKWAYRQFPLDQLHPNTRAKSVAAICAAKLGGNDAFWKFTEEFMKE